MNRVVQLTAAFGKALAAFMEQHHADPAQALGLLAGSTSALAFELGVTREQLLQVIGRAYDRTASFSQPPPDAS